MIPLYVPVPFINISSNSNEIPVTLQIPTVILLTLIFNRKVVYRAFTIYLILGLFILPVFHHGGSLGYLLTPNFGYLLGIYPLIKIIDNLNSKKKINISNTLINGFIAISALHLTGIFYNLIQALLYDQFNLFLYNVGKYTVGKIGYQLTTIILLLFIFKPIKHLKNKNND